MVKIRVQGMPKEVQKTVMKLSKQFSVLEVSGQYANRGSQFVRVYVDVEAK